MDSYRLFSQEDHATEGKQLAPGLQICFQESPQTPQNITSSKSTEIYSALTKLLSIILTGPTLHVH